MKFQSTQAHRKIKVAFLNSHPIQYAAPLYAYLNRSTDIEAFVFYLSDSSLRGYRDKGFDKNIQWDIDLLAGYPHRFVGEAASQRTPDKFFSLVAPSIWNGVRTNGLDALVLHGHNYAANHIALAAARTAGIPVFYRAETHLGLYRSPIKRTLRKYVLPAFFSQIDQFLAIGTANHEFYLAMGVPEDRICFFPYTVDNERFVNQSQLAPEERFAARDRLGLSPDRPAILFVSKLTRRKHPDHALEAAQHLAREGVALDLVIAGSGEMEAELKRRVAADGPLNTIFTGFINQREMPRLFAACDILVLPSENEPWGLIVNEAMCCGLPVVASAEIGSVRDLVVSGENGATFAARDVKGLTDALRPLLTDHALRAAMSARSRETMVGWSYKQNLQGLRAALSQSGIGNGRIGHTDMLEEPEVCA